MRAGLRFAAIAVGGLAAAAATAASAGCGDGAWARGKLERTAAVTGGVYTPAAVTPAAPIVGMWSVTFVDGATGKVADFGYQQWHSDGTEILNSGGRAPASENFCLGVWAELHDNLFSLNHWALSYDPASGALNAKVNIRETVSVGPGGGVFTGSYIQDVYDPAGAHLAHLTGKITGQRITLNQ